MDTEFSVQAGFDSKKTRNPAKTFFLVFLVLSALCFFLAAILSVGGGSGTPRADLTIKELAVEYNLSGHDEEVVKISFKPSESKTYRIYVDELDVRLIKSDEGEVRSFTSFDSDKSAYEEYVSVYLYRDTTYYITAYAGSDMTKIYVIK